MGKGLVRFIGLIIFAFILWRLDIRHIFEQFRRIQLEIFLVAVAGLVAFHLLKALRWRYILGLQEIKYSFINSYLMYLSGLFLGILTPGRLGDFAKTLYLRADGFSTVKAVFSCFLDRVLDLIFLLLCGVFSLFWIDRMLAIRMPLLWVIGVALVLAGAIGKLLGLDRIKKYASRLIPKNYRPLFEKELKGLKTDLKNYSFRNATTLTVYTTIGWLLYFSVIYVLSRSIGLKIAFFDVVAFFVVSTLITFIPITIAGVGTRDLVLLAMFSQVGYVKEDAISFSLLILMSYFLTALFGLIAWLIKPIRL